MTTDLPPITEVDACRDGGLFDRVLEHDEPVVMRGLVADWPLVRAAVRSVEDAARYLEFFYQGAPVTAFLGAPGIAGRLAYTEDLSATNFRQEKTTLPVVLRAIEAAAGADDPPTVYMGSSAIDLCLPGLGEENSLKSDAVRATVRIWLGNRTVVAAHYDVLQNIACVCAGRRRFTLFPPDQLRNLYVGPMELTPAGQQISLVDLNAPDFERFPRFAEALEHAVSAELAPGDAIHIPSMWWHHVQGLEDFNILINHWWRDGPAWAGPPGDALLHAIMSIRDLPPAQREAWRGLFEHYVFDADEDTVAHIPEASRGALGALGEDTARRIRALLRNKLNR